MNDTLTKFRNQASKTKNWEGYRELTKNKDFVVNTDSTGHFSINVKPTDSLYFSSYLYLDQKYAVADLLKRKAIKIQLEKEPCVPYTSCEQKKPSKFYAFVGTKIDLKYEKNPNYCDMVVMDAKYKALYKIEKNLYGNFKKDTISFTAFDHYGIPAFSKYEHVLLFVSEYCNKLFHEKYQYFDVYKTEDGKWARPGDPYKQEHNTEKTVTIKKISFDKNVWFDISDLTTEQIEENYPAAYFRIIDQKAIPFMGVYAEDLVEIKKLGVLKARNITF
ncbi:hypothetical protein ACFFWB_19800 [Flavobacterium procerum]|uniref:hypothetical protein n=1 Tax=Flavobacterium procerum TaxID=1455569 RepID=UPI0035E57F6F